MAVIPQNRNRPEMSEETPVFLFSRVADSCQEQVGFVVWFFLESGWHHRHLHLGGKENTLPLAVWGRDGL